MNIVNFSQSKILKIKKGHNQFVFTAYESQYRSNTCHSSFLLRNQIFIRCQNMI